MNSILKSYIPIANMITKTFGNHCEVVIHDLTQPESSVVYVSNGKVTGRKEGQSFDHLVRQVLLSKHFKDDCTLNYTFETIDGKKIKASSALIRDLDSEVIGMMCINIDLTIAYLNQQQLSDFLPKENDTTPDQEIDFLDHNVSSILDSLIENIVLNKDIQTFKRKDNIELIRFMDEKGVFLVKGAIEKVASCMGLSKVTIYSYLDEVHSKK